MLQLDMTSDAHKFLKAIDAKPFRQIVSKILDIMRNPEPLDSAQLKGYTDLYRVDTGEFRIVYRFDETTLWLILVGKRNDDEVYRPKF